MDQWRYVLDHGKLEEFVLQFFGAVDAVGKGLESDHGGVGI